MRTGPITTTTTEGLQPLGSAAQRSFELVSGALRDRLGAEHAALLAEPVAAAQGQQIDWYAPEPGEVLPLADLPEAEAAALRDRLGVLVAGIRAEADTLSESPRPEDQRLGEALAQAVEIPGPEMIFARRTPGGGLAPLLVHWAWLREERRAVRGVLTAMVPRPAAPVPVAVPTGPWAGWWALIWLGWLLLALMIGAILALLIAPCALMPGRIGACPAPPAALAAAMTEARAAADEVAGTERLLALARRQCQPTVPLTPLLTPPPAPPREGNAAPPPGEAERAAVAARIAARGAARGDLNFTLEWAGAADLDLYVTCPTGATVSHRNRGDCGGTLDLEASGTGATAIADPVENAVFTDAPLGIYKVRAHLRAPPDAPETQVILHVLRRDGPSQSYVGKVSAKDRSWTTIISISK